MGDGSRSDPGQCEIELSLVPPRLRIFQLTPLFCYQIDKKYHLDAMLLSQHMLEDFAFWFGFSDGGSSLWPFLPSFTHLTSTSPSLVTDLRLDDLIVDKDIFRFAFLALRKRWAVPGRYLGVAGLPDRGGSYCGHS
jgi:alpha 1,2-mannosyltransferase